MSIEQPNSRRRFLRTLATAAGGTVVVAATRPVAAAAPVTEDANTQPVAAPASLGYRRTRHVETYYQLADF